MSMTVCSPRVSRVLTAGMALLLARGAGATDLVTADALGHGGAVAADSRAVGSILSAPALQALEPRYDVVLGARLGGTDDWLLQGEARDSRTGPVALSLAYTRRTANPPPLDADLPGWRLPDEVLENPVQESAIVAGVAGALLERRLALGVSGARYARDTAYAEPETDWEAGLGISARPIEPLYLSLGAHHLLDLAKKGDTLYPLTATAGLGLRSELGGLFSQLDLELHDPSASVPLGWRLGGELDLVDGMLPLRLGIRQDPGLDTTYLCAGIGVSTPQATLDYAIVRDVGRGDGASDITGTRTWHTLSLKLLMPDPE